MRRLMIDRVAPSVVAPPTSVAAMSKGDCALIPYTPPERVQYAATVWQLQTACSR
jgi:hypothetical protein